MDSLLAFLVLRSKPLLRLGIITKVVLFLGKTGCGYLVEELARACDELAPI